MLGEYSKNFILTAGFPCQDASIAGKRAGLCGQQTGLFHELARLVDEIKPEWFVLENVPGLLSVNNGKDMWYIVKILSEIGYCVCWRILDAQYFGVAQRRRRLWIVGSFGDTRSIEVLFKQESSRRNDKAEQEMGERRLCISTRDGERQDPTGETLIAYTVGTIDGANGTKKRGGTNIIANTIGATERGNTSFVWQDTYIAEVDADREGKADGFSGEMD